MSVRNKNEIHFGDLLKIDYNSTYVSSNLIDELDYVIGGYGKPNSVFIYSLNTFLEAFILNSSFYISSQELMHIQVISRSIFPNGRPILELLSKTKSLMVVDGIGNTLAQVVSIIKCDVNNPTTYQQRVQDFINNGFETAEARKEYLLIPNVDDEITKLKYLSIGKIEDAFLATVSHNSPQEFYKKLNTVAKETNIQASLPFYTYKYQIEEIQNRGIGKELITKISDCFQKRQNKLNQYFGYTNQNLPPLVTILLKQCNNISEIPSKMLQLREDFTKLRISIENYEKRISEADNIKEQLDAIDELNEFWTVFNKKYSDNQRLLYQFWEVAEGSEYEGSVDKAIDTGNASEMIKVIGKSAKLIFDWYRERKIVNRFRGVTDIWNLFEKSPNLRKQLSEYERLFNTNVDSLELEKLNKKISQIKLRCSKLNSPMK